MIPRAYNYILSNPKRRILDDSDSDGSDLDEIDNESGDFEESIDEVKIPEKQLSLGFNQCKEDQLLSFQVSTLRLIGNYLYIISVYSDTSHIRKIDKIPKKNDGIRKG